MNIPKYNYNQTNFSGLYTINGSYDDLKTIEKSVENKYKSEYKLRGNEAKVYDYAGLFTLPKEQKPTTELLIATNKDAKPLLSFIGANYEQYNFISYPKHDKPYKEVRAMIEAYFRNNADKLLDSMIENKKGIVHDAIKEGKQFLAHFVFTTPDKHVSDINKLQAKEVLIAIKNNCFDFINGVIKK